MLTSLFVVSILLLFWIFGGVSPAFHCQCEQPCVPLLDWIHILDVYIKCILKFIYCATLTYLFYSKLSVSHFTCSQR